jgi:hypothetical protein
VGALAGIDQFDVPLPVLQARVQIGTQCESHVIELPCFPGHFPSLNAFSYEEAVCLSHAIRDMDGKRFTAVKSLDQCSFGDKGF